MQHRGDLQWATVASPTLSLHKPEPCWLFGEFPAPIRVREGAQPHTRSPRVEGLQTLGLDADVADHQPAHIPDSVSGVRTTDRSSADRRTYPHAERALRFHHGRGRADQANPPRSPPYEHRSTAGRRAR